MLYCIQNLSGSSTNILHMKMIHIFEEKYMDQHVKLSLIYSQYGANGE